MIVILVLSVLGPWLAYRKGHNWLAWVFICLVFGPGGTLFALLLPRLPKPDHWVTEPFRVAGSGQSGTLAGSPPPGS
ncbi:hypothetical protein [Nonomuraea roseola]|uniref:DUF805 domain-containing protein n=1 Tax=Nonomuraea roseola TaxID=46179 RepID=A0ABV5Q412_9ACTN